MTKEQEEELIFIFSKLLGKSRYSISKKISLFKEIDVVTKNILYTISLMNDEQKTSAHLILEFIINHKGDIDDVIK